MGELINKDDFSRASKLEKFKLDALSSPLMKLLKIDEINKLYSRYGNLKGIDFVAAVLQDLEIKYEVDEKSLANIPKEGPFIVIANHPYGGIDGLILIHMICAVRPDFKVMANFLLQKIKTIEDHFIPVNPFENLSVNQSSLKGLKLTLEYLQRGIPVGIFPAGEVSSFQADSKQITDTEWKPVIGKIIAKAKVPVVPVYFSGTNSKIFNLLGMIHPAFRTIKLPSELFNKKGNTVKIRIGKPITQKTLSQFSDSDQLLRYLRAKTYALGSALEVKKFFEKPLFLQKKTEEVISPIPLEKLEKDIEKFYGTEKHLFSQDDFDCFVAAATEIPNVIEEIGRLREVTFREVGEGTNKSIDLDEFDLYYHHLFIWDKVNKKIVGAYRIGKGNSIYRRFRKKGFYVNTLFKISRGFIPILRRSIELGRSFICKEYQQKHLSLFLLWRGILIFLQTNPYYKYLIGPVSISNSFSDTSKALMIKFIKQHYFNHELAKHIKPRKEFSFDMSRFDSDILINREKADIKTLDELIAEIEPLNLRVPVLLKKYIKQDAKIIGFNIDPNFSNALDGFMIMDFSSVPEETIKMLEKA